MTKSWNPRRGSKRYEKAGSIVLNRVKLGQAPVSLHKIRWTRRGLWLILGLALVGGALGLWLTLDSRFYVYDAQIDGMRRLSYERIYEASGLDGLHILWARSGVIESRILESLPSLESVDVDCGLPSDCAITVVERRPRVLWADGETLWWVDEEGTVFLAGDGDGSAAGSGDAEAWSDATGGWTVTGPLPRDGEGNLADPVRVTLTELWKTGIDLPSSFQYAEGEGLSFVDEHGWRIIVGKGSGMARRLRVLERLTAHIESRGITPRFVDVRFPDAPYYAPAAD